MDKAVHESILETTVDADDFYVSDLNPSSEMDALERNLPTSLGQILSEML